MPVPSVPIRSRSGDPNYQFRQGVHDRKYFPVGSVGRSPEGTAFDPQGYGWFGATSPGRTDGVGYHEVTGDIVTFTWTKPDTLGTPTDVFLYYRTRAPGGAWSAWVHWGMTGGPIYSITRGPFDHGTEMQWYIRVRYLTEGVIRYDPGGETPPADADAYYLQWFTHYNPYANGYPEMLEDYGGVDVRHGTDFYQFDGSETVQYGMIDMVRWAISWLGAHCCGGEFDGCAETDSRSDAAHHNPRFRGDSPYSGGTAGENPLCCIDFPIHFRWSGSNQHPHYVSGGKGLVGGGDPLDTRPLVNHPEHLPGSGEVWGSEAARLSWRGINHIYGLEPFNNPFYGGSWSWGTAPGTFVLAYQPLYSPNAEVMSKWPKWGLRPGDIIEPVHIQELIDAIDYLIDYGIWTSTQVCTRKRTPGEYMGVECGYHFFETTIYGVGTSGDESIISCQKCCSNAVSAGCSSNIKALGFWIHQWWPGGSSTNQEVPDTCDPWDAPTWAECVESSCVQEKCVMMAERHAQTTELEDPYGCTQNESYGAICDGYGFDPGAAYGCGSIFEDRGCYTFDEFGAVIESPKKTRTCGRRVEGLSYYICTPDECADGWDATHGGLFKKDRLDHTWSGGSLSFVATGPPGNEFSGNCLGDIYGCGTVTPGHTGEMTFHDVAEVYWEGLVPGWLSGCSGKFGCGAGCGSGTSASDVQGLPAPVPGYGYYDPFTGQHLCRLWTLEGAFDPEPLVLHDGKYCRCILGNYPVCKGEAVWVAVDLNLDGTGTPYRLYGGGGYSGDAIPRLRTYDLTKNAGTWMHDCPCETWTGASECT
jgi:hypothetical protein